MNSVFLKIFQVLGKLRQSDRIILILYIKNIDISQYLFFKYRYYKLKNELIKQL